jgi:hypothetical protein
MLNTKGDCLWIETPGGGGWGLSMEQENLQGDVVEFVKESANQGSVAEQEAIMRVWSRDVGFWHILVLVVGHHVHVIGHTEVSWRSSVYCGRYRI